MTNKKLGGLSVDLKTTHCDACGHNLTDEDLGTSIGWQWQYLLGENGVTHPERERVVAMYGKDSFSICHCCVLKTLGVKQLTPSEVEE